MQVDSQFLGPRMSPQNACGMFFGMYARGCKWMQVEQASNLCFLNFMQLDVGAFLVSAAVDVHRKCLRCVF